MFIRVIISFVFLVSINVFAIEKIDLVMIKEATNWIDKYTKEMDFIKATKFHFEGTKFYAHDLVEGKEIITETSMQETMPLIKKYFETSDLEVLKEKDISENFSFTSNSQIATAVFESEIIMSSQGNKYQSHGVTTFVFGIKNNKMVLLESHSKNISFKLL